ncbi:hypothetical protein QWZ04_03935 [Vibrio tapetis subsp. quintayensis]|uniref:glycosyltransferase n=1 Tax=Vibrio tapetis TaxID=52443 RepID=UPI0025B3487D|nr:glycosyltransferase [Vibrio tapetis]MDN3679476.1 hypothetical protein [Vibrio tapetis subsp. quintayensis]
MKCIVIDNVNNLSGAPLICNEIAETLELNIYNLRQSSSPLYKSSGFGCYSDSATMYPFSILFLLFNLSFLKSFIASEMIICNTSLTWFFVILGRLFRKKIVLVLHESSKKNVLYKISIPLSISCANIVVTPSKQAYLDLDIPMCKWRIINNKLKNDYLSYTPKKRSFTESVNILFVDGSREYKGSRLFHSFRETFDRSLLNGGGILSTTDEEFISKYSFSGSLNPQIYNDFDIVLVLTDNRFWRETFGLVGAEAAACGALPIFTDSYAYLEIWEKFSKDLYVKEYELQSLISCIDAIITSPKESDLLRNQVKSHVNKVCCTSNFSLRWKQLILEM